MGIDTAASLFAHACIFSGYSLVGRREYHSNIKGRHSYFDIAFGTSAPSSVGERIDLLLAPDAETLFRHFSMLTTGGIVLHDEADLPATPRRQGFLDAELKARLTQMLGEPATVQTLLSLRSDESIRCYGIPFKALLAELAGELGCKARELERLSNTIGVAVAAVLSGFESDALERAVGVLFQGHAERLQQNRLAVRHAVRFVQQQGWPQRGLLTEARSAPRPPMLLNACQSVALGKLAAGVGLQSYYPISPATDESAFLEAHPTVQRRDSTAYHPQIVQTEDEIAAITLAAGAALTGVRAATATSGPGLSLMAEGLGWAGMNEVPLVLTHYQRGGPSTGMPTRTEQGDLQFAIHAGHGEFPRVV
ncbi:MAG TPA: 2-oxoacid:acceptor oxidoreductase family protein, partial [Gammaproteobacteria bacterium]